MKNHRQIGTVYERAVAHYMEQTGYVMIEYNYRCKAGEIDLIAKDGDCLVFCEVKYRTDDRKGDPLEAVDQRKQKRIFRCALKYLAEHRMEDIPCRFDVIGIENGRVTHIRNAFEG